GPARRLHPQRPGTRARGHDARDAGNRAGSARHRQVPISGGRVSLLEGWPPPVFDPAGPYAWPITVLSWVLLGMAALVFAIVLAALWVALFGTDRQRSRLGGKWVIWTGGIAFPLVVLSA